MRMRMIRELNLPVSHLVCRWQLLPWLPLCPNPVSPCPCHKKRLLQLQAWQHPCVTIVRHSVSWQVMWPNAWHQPTLCSTSPILKSTKSHIDQVFPKKYLDRDSGSARRKRNWKRKKPQAPSFVAFGFGCWVLFSDFQT